MLLFSFVLNTVIQRTMLLFVGNFLLYQFELDQ